MNEFRRDPVSDRWVIVAADRDLRPNQFATASKTQADARGEANCPFCDGQMDTPPMVASYGAANDRPWQVCVVPNLYPVLDGLPPTNSTDSGSPIEMPRSQPASGSRPVHDLHASEASIGLHEVVIESPTHQSQSGQLSVEQFNLMLRAYRDRMRFMREQESIVYAQVMKNRGPAAGASLEHCHSQIFGLPFVPESVEREVRGATDYWQAQQRCVFCDLIAAVNDGVKLDDAAILGDAAKLDDSTNSKHDQHSRLVAEDEDFVAWCPFASRFGFETWIAPKAHGARFEDCDDEMLGKLGVLFQFCLRQIERHPRIDAYNYLIHSLPFDSNCDDHYHWHIEIIPRIATPAGFEWGTGVHINTIDPLQAARDLRSPSNPKS